MGAEAAVGLGREVQQHRPFGCGDEKPVVRRIAAEFVIVAGEVGHALGVPKRRNAVRRRRSGRRWSVVGLARRPFLRRGPARLPVLHRALVVPGFGDVLLMVVGEKRHAEADLPHVRQTFDRRRRPPCAVDHLMPSDMARCDAPLQFRFASAHARARCGVHTRRPVNELHSATRAKQNAKYDWSGRPRGYALCSRRQTSSGRAFLAREPKRLSPALFRRRGVNLPAHRSRRRRRHDLSVSGRNSTVNEGYRMLMSSEVQF